jgi:hypothetical protein
MIFLLQHLARKWHITVRMALDDRVGVVETLGWPGWT